MVIEEPKVFQVLKEAKVQMVIEEPKVFQVLKVLKVRPATEELKVFQDHKGQLDLVRKVLKDTKALKEFQDQVEVVQVADYQSLTLQRI
jgi:hypothetical protein